MNATRRKTLTALDLYALVSAFEGVADRAESAAQDWQYFNALDAMRRAVADADNEVGVADAAESTVQAEADDEQAGYDNLPEGLQQAERGQRMEKAAGHLLDAGSSLSEVVTYTLSAAEAVERLGALLADVLVDEDTGRWLLDDGEEVEGLYEQVKDDLRCAADAAQAAADEVEAAVAC
jgi:soluble cytochrome b562